VVSAAGTGCRLRDAAFSVLLARPAMLVFEWTWDDDAGLGRGLISEQEMS
jgi:hypothetical protein